MAAVGILILMRFDPLGLLRPCPLRTLTGIPCPTCGATSVLRDLAAGDLRGAFRASPLAAAGAIAVALSAIAALAILPWADRVRMPSWLLRKPVLILLVLLVLANWAYLIVTSR